MKWPRSKYVFILASKEDLRSLGCSLAFALNFPTVARKGSVPQLPWLNWEDLKAPTAVAIFRCCWRTEQWKDVIFCGSAQICASLFFF